ncbi:hypothetical protein Ahy_A09g043255 [Arachis hypogaea]|uniref:Transposase MuDR plant domain-containing protein n=1 Tax=Arachis hypogaea TaxID=3818 RepID=A0A445BHV8_ARAHY|nr:hypothetical protein Ahy_A09g043255 [Arachis hypogaea]
MVVPNQNDPDAGLTEYQYQSKDLQTPPGFDSEDKNPVFPQHNLDTKFAKIRLELGMEFGTMQQFKDAVRKYSIQMGKEAFFLKVEPHRCRVICYNETCQWKKKARDMFKVDFDICVRERMMFRAMEKAMDVIEGTEREQYLILRTYLNELLPSQEYWADTEGLPCLPPSYKRPIERPTKKRARHESERQNGSQYKLKRSYGKTSCKYCEKVGHNSRTCPDKKTHVATEEDANAQQAPQVGQPNGRHVQPAAGENLPHLDLEDMSDSEQERFWEETMDAVEEELTQGHPHSEADEEVVHILINSDYSNLTCGT